MINPLKHFGINTEFIRGDTKSYNFKNYKGLGPRCTNCGGWDFQQQYDKIEREPKLRCIKCGTWAEENAPRGK